MPSNICLKYPSHNFCPLDFWCQKIGFKKTLKIHLRNGVKFSSKTCPEIFVYRTPSIIFALSIFASENWFQKDIQNSLVKWSVFYPQNMPSNICLKDPFHHFCPLDFGAKKLPSKRHSKSTREME